MISSIPIVNCGNPKQGKFFDIYTDNTTTSCVYDNRSPKRATDVAYLTMHIIGIPINTKDPITINILIYPYNLTAEGGLNKTKIIIGW